MKRQDIKLDWLLEALHRKWVDYNEIFSPVVKHSSIRMILPLVADRIMELEQLYVKTTFLHGELEETVYMQQPEGFVKDKNKVCLLRKSLYRLCYEFGK